MTDVKYELKHMRMNESFKTYARLIFMILMFFVGNLTGVKAIDTINIEGIINIICVLIGLFISTVLIIFYLEDE